MQAWPLLFLLALPVPAVSQWTTGPDGTKTLNMKGDPAAAKAYEEQRQRDKAQTQRKEAAREKERAEVRAHNARVGQDQAAAEDEREAALRSTIVVIDQVCYTPKGKVRSGTCHKDDVVVPVYGNAACEEAKAIAARAITIPERDHAALRLGRSCNSAVAQPTPPRAVTARTPGGPSGMVGAPPSPTVLDVTSGTVMPRVAGGAVDPRSGTFHVETPSGFVNSKTGEFSPAIK